MEGVLVSILVLVGIGLAIVGASIIAEKVPWHRLPVPIWKVVGIASVIVGGILVLFGIAAVVIGAVMAGFVPMKTGVLSLGVGGALATYGLRKLKSVPF
jgi:hypothetical protein